MLTNSYRTYFHAHKCQKALLHLSWNWWSDHLWWKNCFSWQTAAQIFSDGGQYILRLLTWLRIAILQREVCYCHTTAYINHITSLFWQMKDSCPFTLCKLEIQPFWEWQCVKDTRVGTLIVATIYLQLIQNRYMIRSFTVLQCTHQHCVQPVASDVEVVGYL